MHGPGEDEGVLVTVIVDVGGHRIERIEDLGACPLHGAALAEHGGKEIGYALLAGDFVGGFHLKHQPDGDQRTTRRGQPDDAHRG